MDIIIITVKFRMKKSLTRGDGTPINLPDSPYSSRLTHNDSPASNGIEHQILLAQREKHRANIADSRRKAQLSDSRTLTTAVNTLQEEITNLQEHCDSLES